ncbi:hypothetical protein AGDE_15350 [Angomonas deanei]|uniref:Uncharacterized protein n=1 Tax=Angomonas deanei TaxID=59799 RepID=A0A7G2C9F6_9TRYP|nr:hypothetical protein AGDE_15350 [Angomonas deanei]CAD2216085.1 Protein of unknown function (DUF778), putative [Angomonas deanei]|eukprot:EPY19234.1 hypothetical protein AGDE_15350 [Angomonas deanei]
MSSSEESAVDSPLPPNRRYEDNEGNLEERGSSTALFESCDADDEGDTQKNWARQANEAERKKSPQPNKVNPTHHPSRANSMSSDEEDTQTREERMFQSNNNNNHHNMTTNATNNVFSFTNSKRAFLDSLRPKKFNKSSKANVGSVHSSQSMSPRGRRSYRAKSDASPCGSPSSSGEPSSYCTHQGSNQIDVQLKNKKYKSLLQSYGCCVFFFPSPIISWLAPWVGHVGITNADGTVLYTFETLYYIREENVVEVLAGVLPELREDHTAARPATPSDCHHDEERDPASSGEESPPVYSSTTTNNNVTLSNTEDEGEELFSEEGEEGRVAPSRNGRRALDDQVPPPNTEKVHTNNDNNNAWSDSNQQATTTTNSAAGGGSAQRDRKRRSLFSNSEQNNNAVSTVSKNKQTRNKSHHHTSCVLVWDLKTALMQQRSRRDDHSSGSPSQNGYNNFSFSGIRGENESLDEETANFYNKQLHRAVHVFRGTSMLQSLQNYYSITNPTSVSSFDFVYYVLEACGIPGGLMPLDSAGYNRNHDVSETPTRKADTSAPNDGDRTDHADTNDLHHHHNNNEVPPQWGFLKLSFNIAMRGEWLRAPQRVSRVLHGGNYLIALLLWCLLAYTAYYYYPFIWGRWLSPVYGYCARLFSYASPSSSESGNASAALNHSEENHTLFNGDNFVSQTQKSGFVLVDFVRFLYNRVYALYYPFIVVYYNICKAFFVRLLHPFWHYVQQVFFQSTNQTVGEL